MATINTVNNLDNGDVARGTINDNDSAINVEVIAATADIVTLDASVTALEARFNKQTINLVANTDYDISNPFVFPIVPNIVQIRASDGTLILDAYQNIAPADGDIIIYTGAAYTGAIITIIGW